MLYESGPNENHSVHRNVSLCINGQQNSLDTSRVFYYFFVVAFQCLLVGVIYRISLSINKCCNLHNFFIE